MNRVGAKQEWRIGVKRKNLARIGLLLCLALLVVGFAANKGGLRAAPVAYAQGGSSEPHCRPIGGTVMTNLGVVDQSTTLGVVDGDLKGAVAATLLNVAPGSGGTTIFTVQHPFVTQAAGTMLVDPATSTTQEVVPGSGLYAILNYPLHLQGGPGTIS